MYCSNNKTRLAKSSYRWPSPTGKVTEKQIRYLRDLFIKRGFCETDGKPKDFADTLPCCENIHNYRKVGRFLKTLTVSDVSELICTLR